MEKAFNAFFLVNHIGCKSLDLLIHRANGGRLSVCARPCSKHFVCVKSQRKLNIMV